MRKWKFSESKMIEESSFNPILERFYAYGVSALVRENIQNSLDHRINKNVPVLIFIETGKIKNTDIPGFYEIVDHIRSLKSGNLYTDETIKEMKKHLKDTEYDYISFEDQNSKGLSGSKHGYSYLNEHSYSAYAYSKGVHFSDSNDQDEKLRGGSHGVGKIASNAASILYTMFFANCDESNYKTLGGTVQLIDHKFEGKYYRSTGYFTDENDDKYIPYVNSGFHSIFDKNTRGLKIIVPFLREQYIDKNEIIRTVCDSFLMAIKQNSLEVFIGDMHISYLNIEKIVKDEKYFVQDYDLVRDYFTPIYFDTLGHLKYEDLVIEDLHDSYHFKFYFMINEDIKAGRTAVFRSIGMKIEDMKISSHVYKPYNAILIPKTSDEDVFLKSLENESHTKLEYSHFKSLEYKKNAQKFLANLNNEISKIIDEEMQKLYPSDGVIDTSDLIYEVENTFKSELEKQTTEINIGEGEKGRTLVKTDDTNEPGRSPKKPNNSRKKKPTKFPKIKKTFGDSQSKYYYKVPNSAIKRVQFDDKEKVFIEVNKDDDFDGITTGNLLISLVDGMGVEYNNEYNLTRIYDIVGDVNTKTKLRFTEFTIYNVDFSKGNINLLMNYKNEKSNAKLRFYLEV